jgi:cytoskeletal protein CcmA (bactofilin family)
VRGRIGNDLRVLAAEMTISPTVEGSVLLVGRKIQIQKNAILNNDVLVMGREITLEGNLQGPVQIEGDQVTLNGIVAGDIQVKAETLSIGPEAKILGKLKVISPKPAEVDPKAYFSTPLSWHKASAQPGKELADWFNAGMWYYRMTIFLGLLAVGLLLMAMLPAPSRRYALTIRYRFWASLGWGLFSLVVIPLFLLIFFVTIVGIPLAVVLGLLYLALMFLGRMGVGLLLGLLLLKPSALDLKRSLFGYALGFSLLSAAGWIPIAGSLINFFAILLGMGAIWLTQGVMEPEEKPTAAKVKAPEPGLVPVVSAPIASTPAVALTTALEKPVIAPHAVSSPAAGEWKPGVPAFKRSSPVAVKKTSRKSTVSPAGSKPAVRKKAVKKTPKA